MQASNGIRSDSALIHIYREKSCTASALPASYHLFQPSSRATHPANKLTEENMTLSESIQFSRHLPLNPRFMGSLIRLPELKKLRCRHVPSCHLPSKTQEEKEHPEATHSCNVAEVISHLSGTCDLVHPHKICQLMTIHLFHKSCCVKCVTRAPFCFPVTYRNRTLNNHKHKRLLFLLKMYT